MAVVLIRFDWITMTERQASGIPTTSPLIALAMRRAVKTDNEVGRQRLCTYAAEKMFEQEAEHVAR